MDKDFDTTNKFEHKSKRESLAKLVAHKMTFLTEWEQKREKKLQSYPRTFEDYSALDLNDRMTAAASIFLNESPRMRRGEKTPKDAPWFDISELTDEEGVRLYAQIVHSEGSWTNALNDTYVDKLPNLQITVQTYLGNSFITDRLGDLEVVSHYGEGPGFRVVGSNYGSKPIDEPEDPLFRDIVAIVDISVADLYRRKLADRIQRLGNIAAHSEDSEV